MKEREPQAEAVTALLAAWGRGDEDARDRLLPIVYAELRRRAAAYLRRERPGHTLQPTALVHEVYLRLVGQQGIPWQNRAQFFGVAAGMMRRILVDHARGRRAGKRGGGAFHASWEDDVVTPQGDQVDIAAVDDALNDLARLDPRQSQIVELRYFGGLSIEETADVLKISPATVKREWTVARAWLYGQVQR